MAIADVAANLRLNIANFSSNLAIASRQMSNFARTMNRQYGDASRVLTRHNLDLKDTARIVQGIVVAQTFYSGARAIREATGSLWEFNKALDYAHVTYSALFGDAQLATNFMNVLKEHSIETIFDYEDLASASKKLLAYGIEYENLMFIMEGLTNLGAMSGDTAALDRISLALGQIYTRGKLTAEEMRQLANAYVPISEIIQDKFNLTPEQMGSVGDLNLPANEVINAIVDYANEEFASVGDAAMYTITGLQNKIVDSLKVMGTEMMAPITTAYKSFLAYIADGLEAIRSEFSSGGIGGVFEYLVPDPQMQALIRQFVANVRNLFMALVSAGVVAGQVFGNFVQVLMTAFNIVGPFITILTNSLFSVLNAMLNTRAGAIVLRIALLGAASAFVVLRGYALGALAITAVTKAVMQLAQALIILATLIARNPIIALVAGLAFTLTGVAVASGKASAGLGNFFNALSGGAGAGDVLQNIGGGLGDINASADEFNNRLGEGVEGANDLADAIGGAGDAAGKAKKKAGLLSFDEVFKLNDPNAGGGGGGGGGGLGGLGDLGGLGGGLIPEIPDFSDFISGFTDGLFGGLMDSFLGKLGVAGLGTWLMSKIVDSLRKLPLTGLQHAARNIAVMLFRALQGAFMGLGVDALMSLVTERLWQALEDAFNLEEGAAAQAKLGATIGSMIGGAIGMVAGGIKGSLIGAAIGHLAGGVVGLLWEEISGALGNTVVGLGSGVAGAIAKSLGVGFGSLLSSIDFSSLKSAFTGIATTFKTVGLKAIAKGGVIGMAIGFITDGIAALLWNTLAEKFALSGAAEGSAKVGQTIGGVIGTVIGGILGGPAGALLGSVIGTFAGGFVGLFWEKIKAAFVNTAADLGAWWTGLQADWENAWNSISAGFSNWWGTTKSNWISAYGEIKSNISSWWSEVKTAYGTLQTEILDSLSTWWNDTKTNWSARYNEIRSELSTWWSGVKSDYDITQTAIFSNLSAWWESTKATWSAKYTEIKTNLSTWWTEVKDNYSTKQTEIIESLTKWWNTTKSSWATKYAEIKSDLSLWWTNVKNEYDITQTAIYQSLSAWFDNTKETWVTKYAEIKSDVDTWWSTLKADIGTYMGEMLNTIVTKLGEVKTKWSEVWGEIKTNFGQWWTDLKTSMGNWLETSIWQPISSFFNVTNFWNRIKSSLDGIKSKLSNWWSDVKDIFSGGISVSASVTGSASGGVKAGHATGGIFNREHIARFAEGNKAEAVIPLENASAMQPFVNAISDGILQGLMPVMVASSSGNQNNMPPMYVGTLIADDRGLKQLYKKFEIIEAQEAARKGFA